MDSGGREFKKRVNTQTRLSIAELRFSERHVTRRVDSLTIPRDRFR